MRFPSEKNELTKKDLEEDRDIIDELALNVKLTTRNISPSYILKDGLEDAIQNYLRALTPLKTSFQSEKNEVSIPTKIGINIYRIVLELCNNILKHSEASELSVAMYILSKKVIIKISHNGIGMTNDDFLNNLETSNGIGLNFS